MTCEHKTVMRGTERAAHGSITYTETCSACGVTSLVVTVGSGSLLRLSLDDQGYIVATGADVQGMTTTEVECIAARHLTWLESAHRARQAVIDAAAARADV